MKTNFAATALILASAAIMASPSFASDTREQVRAELTRATRYGEIVSSGELGLKLNEINPSLYPAKSVQANVTREQVKTELAQAIRSGDIIASGELGMKRNEMNPGLYPAKQA